MNNRIFIALAKVAKVVFSCLEVKEGVYTASQLANPCYNLEYDRYTEKKACLKRRGDAKPIRRDSVVISNVSDSIYSYNWQELGSEFSCGEDDGVMLSIDSFTCSFAPLSVFGLLAKFEKICNLSQAEKKQLTTFVREEERELTEICSFTLPADGKKFVDVIDKNNIRENLRCVMLDTTGFLLSTDCHAVLCMRVPITWHSEIENTIMYIPWDIIQKAKKGDSVRIYIDNDNNLFTEINNVKTENLKGYRPLGWKCVFDENFAKVSSFKKFDFTALIRSAKKYQKIANFCEYVATDDSAKIITENVDIDVKKEETVNASDLRPVDVLFKISTLAKVCLPGDTIDMYYLDKDHMAVFVDNLGNYAGIAPLIYELQENEYSYKNADNLVNLLPADTPSVSEEIDHIENPLSESTEATVECAENEISECAENPLSESTEATVECAENEISECAENPLSESTEATVECAENPLSENTEATLERAENEISECAENPLSESTEATVECEENEISECAGKEIQEITEATVECTENEISECAEVEPLENTHIIENEKNEGISICEKLAERDGLALIRTSEGVYIEELVTRATYKLRKDIRANGGRWNKKAKQWQATDQENIDKLYAWFNSAEITEIPESMEVKETINKKSQKVTELRQIVTKLTSQLSEIWHQLCKVTERLEELEGEEKTYTDATVACTEHEISENAGEERSDSKEAIIESAECEISEKAESELSENTEATVECIEHEISESAEKEHPENAENPLPESTETTVECVEYPLSECAGKERSESIEAKNKEGSSLYAPGESTEFCQKVFAPEEMECVKWIFESARQEFDVLEGKNEHMQSVLAICKALLAYSPDDVRQVIFAYVRDLHNLDTIYKTIGFLSVADTMWRHDVLRALTKISYDVYGEELAVVLWGGHVVDELKAA